MTIAAATPMPSTDAQQFAQGRHLFLCCLPYTELQTFLPHLPGQTLDLLIPQVQQGRWQNHATITVRNLQDEPAGNFGVQEISPGLLLELQAKQYQSVIIPVHPHRSWKNSHAEKLAAQLTETVIWLHPNGEIESYSGETLQRLIYNKTYLCNMLRFVPRPQEAMVLEVGCSDGLPCHLLRHLGAAHIVGLDVREDVGCLYPHPNITYHRMDAAHTPFADQSFDLCHSVATLEHVSNPFAVLMEMKRVLKIGGYGFIHAGPLYHAPFGHHIAPYFQDFPWIHLRLTPAQIHDYCKTKGIDRQIQTDTGLGVEEYLTSMLSPSHINGLTLAEYRIEEFLAQPDLEVIKWTPSYHGEALLTDEILQEVAPIRRNDLLAEGFVLIFRKLPATELERSQFQLEQTRQALQQAEARLQQQQIELQTLRTQLRQTQTKNQQLKSKIQAMEQSQFWRFQQRWMRLKQGLGFTKPAK